MSNRKQLRARCIVCNREREPDERFSARGKCSDCGERRLVENHRAMLEQDGPFFDHWLERCRAAFGVRAHSRAGD